MALTFKKRDDLDKVLGDLAVLPPQVVFTDIEKIEKTSDKSVKTPEDFLKQFNTDLPIPDIERSKDVK
ncbi:hypothetical protein GYN24_04570 [Lactococcus piscium]|uniref:Uncharacterized protein n=1 Tax=Pseudolactococcus paracarnosus TaxID=2749962 RepID=A0A7L4WE99_9LACT|nr:SPJ_0845 family protein [Lactococcus paracarnosus]MCJ1993851.1 hypothetical protein [Lactococcus paracarnosus]QDJ28537.1 hypothetical protein BHS01_08365 [Lactococcus paracarnosus]SPC38213.1 hypothetical protein LPICM02_80091 [Lactococcus piscium]